MSAGREVETYTDAADELLRTPPLLGFHEKPHYPRDPGTGVEFRIKDGEVIVSMFWDGAQRTIIAFPVREFREALS